MGGGLDHESQGSASPPRPPLRCVSLQLQAAQERGDSEPFQNSALLMEMENRLLEMEEKFTSIGHKEKCVDIKLERAKMKRWVGPRPLPALRSASLLPPRARLSSRATPAGRQQGLPTAWLGRGVPRPSPRDTYWGPQPLGGVRPHRPGPALAPGARVFPRPYRRGHACAHAATRTSPREARELPPLQRADNPPT